MIALAAPGGAGSAASASKVLQHAPALATVRELHAKNPLDGFEPLSQRLQGSTLVSDLPDGRHAELTLEPGLQSHVRAMLRDYAVPYGALLASQVVIIAFFSWILLRFITNRVQPSRRTGQGSLFPAWNDRRSPRS